MKKERAKYGERTKGIVLAPNVKRGRLLILEEVEPRISKRSDKPWLDKKERQYRCLCDCGKEVIKTWHTLMYGVEPSCGCATIADVKVGDKFGHLTILEELPKRKKWEMRRFRCICDCGNETTITYQSLHKDVACKDCTYKDISQKKRVKTDRERLYIVWHSIKNRTKHNECYTRKGIAVCKEWIDSFESFYEWSMANGYRQGLTIDRIDNFGDYRPDNCRWTTSKVQSMNREVTVHLTYNGETHTVPEWSEITGISEKNIRQRINKCKMPVGMALGFEPMRRTEKSNHWKSVQQLDTDGNVIREFKTRREAAKELHVAEETVDRICNGGKLRLPRIKAIRLRYKPC